MRKKNWKPRDLFTFNDCNKIPYSESKYVLYGNIVKTLIFRKSPTKSQS